MDRGRCLRRLSFAVFLVALPISGQNSPITVTAGTRLRVEFNSPVGTDISRANDGVEVHLLKPVIVQTATFSRLERFFPVEYSRCRKATSTRILTR